MNFIFVSLQRINTDRESTSTSLARELAKEHNVLYVNPPIDRKSLNSYTNDKYVEEHIHLIKNKNCKLIRASSNLHVLYPSTILESINWIPFTPIFSFFNKLNNKRFSKDIQKAINEIGFESFILINDKDIFRSFYLKEMLKPELYIYLDRDNTLAIKYWKRHGKILEPILMQKSDLIICNSPAFKTKALKFNKNSYYIGNGCGLDVYDRKHSGQLPKEIQNIKGPIIGYVGALNSLRLDLALILEIVELRVDWSFVFIGPNDQKFESSKLYQLPNVHYLGKIHNDKVPSYIDSFDICLNPQLVNEITDGNFPLKIVEYLALGKPTVATATTTMKEIFNEFTYLASSSEEYIRLIELALREDSSNLKEKRRLFARQFGWDVIAKNLLTTIQKTSDTTKHSK